MSEEKLPKGWRKLTISMIGKVVTGNTPSKNNPEFFNGNIPWVKPGDVKKSRIIFQSEETLTELGAKKARLIPQGSVIVTCIGDLGNITVAGKELATNQQINSIVVDEKIADFKYIYYWSLTLKSWLIENSTSTTISMVNKSKFENAPVILPPLREQQRIVARLDAIFGHLDVLREKLDRIPELLKNFRQQVLTQAVTGDLTREWREGKELGEWEELPLSELIIEKPRNGYSPKAVDFVTEVKSLTLSATTKGYFDPTHVKYLDIEKPENDSHLWLKNGDILIQRSNSLDFVGTAAIYDGEDNEFIYPDLMMKIRANDQIETRYLFYVLSSKPTKDYFKTNASGTAGNMPKINQGTVMNTPIPYPSLEEQDLIVEKVNSLFELADKIESQYQSLKVKIDQMPQAILAKAFRGELVGQEEKEYVREVEELGMVAEGNIELKN